MESNKPKLLTIEEYDNSIDEICDSIMRNIIEYLSEEVYVEKEDKFFIIKSYNNNTKNSEKEFLVKINKNEFYFNLYKKSTSTITAQGFYITAPNNLKEKNYETGSFNVKISSKIFNKYENWIISKSNEYMLQKINSLQSNLYLDFKLDKILKRKKITKNIINEKEDL